MSTNGTRIAVFATAEVGHFQRLLPLIRGLVRRGASVGVRTDARFRAEVLRAGADFTDLFAGRRPEALDNESLPRACRSVSFAGHFGEELAEELCRERPALIVYDTFAVIGQVVARALEIPAVNVCAGHNVHAAMLPSALREFPRVFVSPTCHAAVERLRERHGIAEASPFHYATATSPWLNVYCEPPQFLEPHERQPFEPLEFFGSLADARPCAVGTPPQLSAFGGGPDELRVYVSFGTVVWRYFQPEALAALQTLAAALSARPDVRTLISLAGAVLSAEERARLEQPRVSVVDHADQCTVLREADVFVTHHGLNSTHEAIDHGVPMLSYPFLWDQPALARKCRDFGIAVPLRDGLRQPLRAADVDGALELVEERGFLQAELGRARDWELATLAGRERVIDRILNLATAP